MLRKLTRQSVHFNRSICSQYDQIVIRITTSAKTTDELVDLENYIQFLKGLRFMVLEPSVIELDKFIRLFNKNVLDISFKWNPIGVERYLPTDSATVIDAGVADGDNQ